MLVLGGTSQSRVWCLCPSQLSTGARTVTLHGPPAPPGDPALVPDPRRDSGAGRGPCIPPALGTKHPYWAAASLGRAIRCSGISREQSPRAPPGPPRPQEAPGPVSPVCTPSTGKFAVSGFAAPEVTATSPGKSLSPPCEGRAPPRGSSRHPASLRGDRASTPALSLGYPHPDSSSVGRCHLYSTFA